MQAKGGTAVFRYNCPDCGSTKEFAQRPALPPTCCGHVMDQLP